MVHNFSVVVVFVIFVVVVVVVVFLSLLLERDYKINRAIAPTKKRQARIKSSIYCTINYIIINYYIIEIIIY